MTYTGERWMDTDNCWGSQRYPDEFYERCEPYRRALRIAQAQTENACANPVLTKADLHRLRSSFIENTQPYTDAIAKIAACTLPEIIVRVKNEAPDETT